MAGSATEQFIDNPDHHIDPGRVATSGGIGALGGAVAGTVSVGIGPPSSFPSLAVASSGVAITGQAVTGTTSRTAPLVAAMSTTWLMTSTGDGANASPPENPEEGGIYEFPDQTENSKPYVDQSKNLGARLAQHERSGRLRPGTEITTPFTGDQAARELAEHNRIQELTGGQTARKSPNVANKKDPIGPKRRPTFQLPEPSE